MINLANPQVKSQTLQRQPFNAVGSSREQLNRQRTKRDPTQIDAPNRPGGAEGPLAQDKTAKDKHLVNGDQAQSFANLIESIQDNAQAAAADREVVDLDVPLQSLGSGFFSSLPATLQELGAFQRDGGCLEAGTPNVPTDDVSAFQASRAQPLQSLLGRLDLGAPLHGGKFVLERSEPDAAAIMTAGNTEGQNRNDFSLQDIANDAGFAGESAVTQQALVRTAAAPQLSYASQVKNSFANQSSNRNSDADGTPDDTSGMPLGAGDELPSNAVHGASLVSEIRHSTGQKSGDGHYSQSGSARHTNASMAAADLAEPIEQAIGKQIFAASGPADVALPVMDQLAAITATTRDLIAEAGPDYVSLFSDRQVTRGPFIRTLELTLEPADLGHVRVRMNLAGRDLKLEIETSERETARLLTEDSSGLDRSLRDAGLNLSDLSVVVETAGPKPSQSVPFASSPHEQNARGMSQDHSQFLGDQSRDRQKETHERRVHSGAGGGKVDAAVGAERATSARGKALYI